MLKQPSYLRSLNLTALTSVSLLAPLSSTVIAEEFNYFYLGYRGGVAKNVEIDVQGRDYDIENVGVMTSLYGGYNFNKNWSAEISVAYMADLDLIFISGDDISLFSKSLTGNYTHFLRKGFFIRGHLGIDIWELEAEDHSSLLGFELELEEDVRLEKDGESLLLGTSIGNKIPNWFEWTILGVRSSYSDDIKWTAAYTGVRFYF